MATRVKGIRIRAFRGIPYLEIPLEGKSLVIKGENGTGKSSIVEAIEFFFGGRVEHLEGMRGVSLHKHGPHVLFGANDVEVGLSFDPGNVILQRTMKEPPVPPQQLASIFDAAKGGTYILRRFQVLEFVESDPAERFVAIGNIMGVSVLDQTELNLMRVKDQLQGQVDLCKWQRSKLYEEINGILGEKISSLDEALPAISRCAESLELPSIQSMDEIPKFARKVYAKLSRKTRKAPLATKLDQLVAIFDKPLLSDDAIARMGKYASEVNELVSEGAKKKVRDSEFLDLGRNLLLDGSTQTCPLCGQPIDQGQLLREIDERREKLVQLSKRASVARRESVVVWGELQEFVSKLDSALGLVADIPGLSDLSKRLVKETAFFKEYQDMLIASKEFGSQLGNGEFLDHHEIVASTASGIARTAEALLEKIELSKEENEILTFFQAIGAFRTKVGEISKVEANLALTVRQAELSGLLYNAFSESKKARVQETYDTIEDDIQEFYSRLHPRENPRTIKLRVEPGRRASTKIAMNSFNLTEEDPRALESEGHLDSLGICIFLAFVKAFSSECPLMILDDVVTTIDASHRQRLAELLLEEFAEKQLVVSTHDEMWYDQFTALERAYRVENSFLNLEITGWDLESGPKIRKYRPRWEGIQERIAAGDKRSAGNESRQYLEWVLMRGCVELRVPVALQVPPHYEVSDLMSPLRARVSMLLIDGDFKQRMTSAFDTLEKTLLMGNLLSHENIDASNVSIEEVRRFAESIRALHLCFCCSACSSFLAYARDFSMIRCSNKKCTDPLEVKTRS